jgi:hypothetical protein
MSRLESRERGRVNAGTARGWARLVPKGRLSPSRMARGQTLRVWAAGLFLGLVILGCRMVTPAELATFESHGYAGRSQAQLFAATVTSLKSLGFDVVLADKGAFRIKTAPKVVMVHAVASSSSTAVAMSDTVAWTIDVTAGPSGAALHAEPRLYSAGQSIEATKLNYDFADKMFKTLYDEIDSNLPGGAPAPAVAPTTAVAVTAAAPSVVAVKPLDARK